MMIGKSRVRDLHPEGVITAAQVLQRSSNIGTVKIARQLGKQRLHEALLRFGLGRRTGVGLAGERAGVLYGYQKWGDIHFANIAFGYGVMVTPLQLVAGLCGAGQRWPVPAAAAGPEGDPRRRAGRGAGAAGGGARAGAGGVGGDGAHDAGDHDRGDRAGGNGQPGGGGRLPGGGQDRHRPEVGERQGGGRGPRRSSASSRRTIPGWSSA